MLFWKRIGAMLIDTLVVFAILIFVSNVIIKEIIGYIPEIIGDIFTAIFYIYILIKDYIVSIGSRIFKIKVVSVDNANCNFIRSIGRNITFFFFLWILELIFMIVRKDKRRIGDLIAGTKVVAA